MKKSSVQSGFTLVEMLVAIAIIFIFAGGMLISRGDFDSTVRLGSVTREVALLARQAQTYGAGGGSDATVNVGKAHGIYLESESEIFLYADENADGYDPSSDNKLETFQLPSEYRVSNPSNFDIYFTRPTLRASTAETITIEHKESGKTREVVISASGYISTP